MYPDPSLLMMSNNYTSAVMNAPLSFLPSYVGASFIPYTGLNKRINEMSATLESKKESEQGEIRNNLIIFDDDTKNDALPKKIARLDDPLVFPQTEQHYYLGDAKSNIRRGEEEEEVKNSGLPFERAIVQKNKEQQQMEGERNGVIKEGGHHLNNKFTCKYCGRSFQSAVSRGVHSRIHKQEAKPPPLIADEYNCDVCNRHFAGKG